ncbi:recombinase family protein [Microbacterium sp. ARD31]|uniref:recombinase family protein n=1 Tax=Microbacterium sp. ARD31 TaxID=2962576 RepID=UPI0028817310|nr:recombinase family protein [Microbacterium sp. ARD31]MDT0184332.1 recombinase family protein [Microbacterium sp. ARD31]
MNNDDRGAASLYIRLSRQATGSNLSLEGMIDDCQRLAGSLGLTVHAVHVDNGTSGAIRNRPEFLAWLEDARSGDAGTLIASHSDRLTREGVNAAALVLDVVEGKDSTTGSVVRSPVRLVTVDGLDSERDAEAFRWRFVIAAEVARAERERIRSRNIATKQRLAETSRFPGGAIPFGCRVVERPDPMAGGKVGKYLERNDGEAIVLEEVAARLLRGDSVRSTVHWLNTEGIKTRRGYEWQRTTLVSTLLSAPSREHVFNAATHHALSVRLQPKRHGVTKHNGGRPAAHLLVSGIGLCGGCGGKLTTAGGRPKAGGGRYPTRYVCMAASKGGACPGGGTINAVACDEEIERRFLERLGDEPYVEIRTVLMGGDELEEAKAADKAAQAALSENLTTENFAAAQEARARLEARQAQPIQRTDTLHLTGLTVRQTWTAADVEGRRAMLADNLAEPVRLMPGKPKQGPGRGKIVNLDRIHVSWRVDDPA